MLKGTSLEAGDLSVGEEAILRVLPAESDKSVVNEAQCGESKPLQNGVRPKVSVVIVTYRSSGELPECIASVLRQPLPVEVFLVDNASPDSTPQMVADYTARFENVHAILNSENIGLAAGNNCPLGGCQGDYVLVLNPDTVLPENSLARMVDLLDHSLDIGVLGPKNLYEDGTPHVSFHRHWGFLSVLMWRIIPYRFPRSLYDRFSSYECQDVLFVSGACLLIRRSIFEQIGGYDPEYFLTVEDVVDLCIRAKRTGCRIVFSPEVEVFHFTGRSGAQAPYIVVWQANRGTVYHFLKHKGVVQAYWVSLLLILSAAARVGVATLLGIFKKRYRSIARIYARVLWSLLVLNPISATGRRSGEEASRRDVPVSKSRAKST
jgi:GT2 family glycosyltransferase